MGTDNMVRRGKDATLANNMTVIIDFSDPGASNIITEKPEIIIAGISRIVKTILLIIINDIAVDFSIFIDI